MSTNTRAIESLIKEQRDKVGMLGDRLEAMRLRGMLDVQKILESSEDNDK